MRRTKRPVSLISSSPCSLIGLLCPEVFASQSALGKEEAISGPVCSPFVVVVVIRSSGDRVLWGLAMLVFSQARLQLNTPPAHFVFAQRVSCEGGDTAVQPVLTSYRWPSLPSTTPQREKYREIPRVVDSSAIPRRYDVAGSCFNTPPTASQMR